MVIKEEQRDLFSVPHGYHLAHCISADFALGAGVAKQIEQRYGMRSMLFNMYGTAANDSPSGFDGWDWKNGGPVCLACSNVLNLVTKNCCFHKPTLASLELALEDMKMVCREQAITKVAMPHIGCGLDRLNWGEVRPLIEAVFADMDIEILVCVL